MNQKELAINIRNVHKTFGSLKAIDGIDLEIRSGEYVALLGPNGAGKTTLVEMIEGIQKQEKGFIELFGMNWQSNEKELRSILGFSLQETRFVEKLTVLETMKLFTSFYKLPFSRCEEILRLSGLESKINAFVENLSGGQRQKLALAIALVNSPRILILDEPTTGLDPGARRELWDILLQLKRKSTTLILTTHYMEEAENLCERIVFIDKGKILAQGTIDELLSKQGLNESVHFKFLENSKSIQWNKLAGYKNLFWEEEGYSGKFQIDELVKFIPDFFRCVQDNKLTLVEFETRKMTLDDLFLSMTGRKLED